MFGNLQSLIVKSVNYFKDRKKKSQILRHFKKTTSEKIKYHHTSPLKHQVPKYGEVTSAKFEGK